MLKNNHLIWISFQNAGALIDFYAILHHTHLRLRNWMKKNCLHFFLVCITQNFCLRSFEKSCYINKVWAHCAVRICSHFRIYFADFESERTNTDFDLLFILWLAEVSINVAHLRLENMKRIKYLKGDEPLQVNLLIMPRFYLKAIFLGLERIETKELKQFEIMFILRISRQFNNKSKKRKGSIKLCKICR